MIAPIKKYNNQSAKALLYTEETVREANCATQD